MKEAFRDLGAPNTIEDAGCRNAKTVDENCDRNRGENQEYPLPYMSPVPVGEDQAQHQKGHHVPKAAARLYHLQLCKTQVDNVSFTICGHAVELQHGNADLRRNKLQTEGEADIDDLGQREHPEHHRHGKPDGLQLLPTEMQPHDPDNHEPEGNVEREEFPTEFAYPEEDEAETQRQNPPPRDAGGQRSQSVPLLPDKVKNDKGDQVAVVVVLLLPVIANQT